MTDDADDQTATAAAINDDTTIVSPPTEAAPELAWSVDDGAKAPIRRQSWGMTWGQAAVIAACGLALATAIGAAVFVAEQAHQRNGPTTPSAPMPSRALPPISTAAPSTMAVPAPNTPPVATSTVTVAVPAPAPPIPAPPPTEGMFAICPSGRSGVATTVTSCAFADNVRTAYLTQGGPDVLAYSPVTGDTYAMDCIGGFTAHLSNGAVVQAVRCTGGDNAVVVVW